MRANESKPVAWRLVSRGLRLRKPKTTIPTEEPLVADAPDRGRPVTPQVDSTRPELHGLFSVAENSCEDGCHYCEGPETD